MTRLDRRTFALGLGAGLGTLGFAATAQRAFAQGKGDLSNVVLRIGDQTGATQSKLRTAGLLNDVPYKIDWSVYPAAVNLHEALKADAIDIGAANDSPTVSAIAGGSKIAAVAGWYNGRGAYLLVPKDSPIRSIADLRGKTVSPTTRGSVAHYLVVGELRKNNIPLDQVKLAFLNPADAAAAFASGSIDAWGTWSVYAARARGSLGARVISDGVGINSGLLVLSATRNALKDAAKVAAIQDYASRVDRAFAWSVANKAEHIKWSAGFTKQDETIVSAIYEDEASYRRVPTDDRFVARLRETFETWRSVGILSGTVDFNDYVFRDLKIG
jgi:sulfonate transport system substrate-binding protein